MLCAFGAHLDVGLAQRSTPSGRFRADSLELYKFSFPRLGKMSLFDTKELLTNICKYTKYVNCIYVYIWARYGIHTHVRHTPIQQHTHNTTHTHTHTHTYTHAHTRNSKISGKQQDLPKQQNLSSNEIRTINLWVSFPKEAQIGCPDLQRLPFKGSLLLQNLVGPGYLDMPF